MSYFKSTRPAWIYYAAALAGLVLAAGAVKIIEYDVWWHLTTGWVIANLHIIPRYDIFSYTAFGHPWMNHEWLFQLIQWLIYDNGGPIALTIMKLMIVAATTCLLFVTVARLAVTRNAALWASILFLWQAAYRVMDRPFLVGMLLLAIYGLILHTYVRRKTRAVWALPLLQIFWINTHGGGLLGLEVVLAFAAGESLQAFAEKRLGGPAAIDSMRRERLWVVGALCALSCIINPWGFDAFVFPFQHMQMHEILSHTREWLPVLHPALDGLIPPIIVLAVFGATVISFILNTKKASVSHLLLFAMTAMLLPKGHRFGAEFLIVNLPIMFSNFASFAKERGLSYPGYAYSWIQLAAAFAISSLALSFGIPISLNGEMLNYVGIGATTISAPARMVDFLEYHKIRGRVFNHMGTGAYLIFRRWPGELVFIDGRTPVYGDEFYGRFIDALRYYRNFEQLDSSYKFDYLVFAADNAAREENLQRGIWQNPQWKLVYAGSDGLVYLRNEPKFAELIKRLELKKNPLIEFFDSKDKPPAKRETQATPVTKG